ncbi:hypothetical protein D018_2712A, partial [Vibrio parahaemolyticus VP2007-007]
MKLHHVGGLFIEVHT